MKSTLSPEDLAFLQKIKDRQDTGDPAVPYMPIRARLQSMIDRGYVRTTRLIIPALNCYSDDVGLRLTEAGEIVLKMLSRKKRKT